MVLLPADFVRLGAYQDPRKLPQRFHWLDPMSGFWHWPQPYVEKAKIFLNSAVNRLFSPPECIAWKIRAEGYESTIPMAWCRNFQFIGLEGHGKPLNMTWNWPSVRGVVAQNQIRKSAQNGPLAGQNGRWCPWSASGWRNIPLTRHYHDGCPDY